MSLSPTKDDFNFKEKLKLVFFWVCNIKWIHAISLTMFLMVLGLKNDYFTQRQQNNVFLQFQDLPKPNG